MSDITPNVYKTIIHNSGLSGSNIGPDKPEFIPKSSKEEIQSYLDRFFNDESDLIYKAFLHSGNIRPNNKSSIYLLKSILNAWSSTMNSLYKDSDIENDIEIVNESIDELEKALDNLEGYAKIENHLFVAALAGLLISNIEHGNKKNKSNFNL